jgi:hypothetical protein
MKTFRIPLLLLAATLAASAEQSQPAPRFRDAVTHQQLVQRLRYSENNDPMKALDQSTGEDPSKVNQPSNLLEDSDIICFDGLATLVPKQAILAAPAGIKSRLGLQPGARIVGWLEFYTANRGWITTVEVDRPIAEGNKAIAGETRERIGKSRNLVVATCMGGPISVLPLKPEAQASNTTRQP